MAGDPSAQLTWHLSGGTTNPDADLSLGGARSNTQIRGWATTVGANGAAGDVRIQLASVTSESAKYALLYFRDGNCGGWSSQIVAVDVTNNWVQILEPLPAAIAIGDNVWFYSKTFARMPYKNTSALESALGFTQYIGLYVTNAGGTLTDFRFWIDRLNPGPVLHEIASSMNTTVTLPTIPNQETEPDLSGLLFPGAAGRWNAARTFDSGWPIFNYSSGTIGFWLKRVAPANALRVSDQAVAIVAETPGGFSSRLVIHWDTAGFTPILQLSHAPTVYIRGGARFKATVTGQETGLRVPNVPVGFALTDGPGTLTPPEAPGETDENGEALARYAAPMDVGEIGNTFTVEAQV